MADRDADELERNIGPLSYLFFRGSSAGFR
jgi:hypothetical protein